MTKRVNNLEKIAEMINNKNPSEMVYDLGKAEKRTEALVTFNDGVNKIINRIASSPLIRLYDDGGEILMDFTDSDKNADRYSYFGLKPLEAAYGEPNNPPYELGDLAISLADGNQLTIAPYLRPEKSKISPL